MMSTALSLRAPADEYTGPPKERFFAKEWYARDLEAVFRPRWLVAGHVDELDAAGGRGYLTFALDDDEVFIRRDEHGEVRAFFNVCPHRGFRLCEGPSGTAPSKRIVCPYHLWTYSASDGSIINSREMHEDFDSGAYGLLAAPVAVWNGVIFVCLGDEPPGTIEEYFANVTLNGYDLGAMKLAAAKRHEIRANWKLVIENNLECYHCVQNHPELTAAVDWRYMASGEFDAFCSDRAAGLEVFCPAFGSQTSYTNGGALDEGRLCAVPTPRSDSSLKDGEPISSATLFEPGASILIERDYAWMFVPVPLDPERTELRQYWFVSRDAEEGKDYEVDKLTSLLDTTMQQDRRLCERLQQGVRQRAYTPGPLNRVHQVYNAGFYRWYEATIEAHGAEFKPAL